MTGMGDHYNVQIDRDQRGDVTCECGNEYEPEGGARVCPDCARREYDRTHPLCTCGAPAQFVADIIVPDTTTVQGITMPVGRVIERRPWCSVACARGAEDEENPVEVSLVSDDIATLLVLMPCWCGMPGCMWCPQHGWKTGGNET